MGRRRAPGARTRAHAERGVQRGEERRVAERLGQIGRRAGSQHAQTDAIVLLRGDEDDREGVRVPCEHLLQLGAGHPRHGDVENETARPAHVIRREELLGRRECLDGESEFPQQVGKRLTHGIVVVDDRHEWRVIGHGTFVSCVAVVAESAHGTHGAFLRPG